MNNKSISSGFKYEPVGVVYDKNVKIRKNKDGTITFVQPKTSKKK